MLQKDDNDYNSESLFKMTELITNKIFTVIIIKWRLFKIVKLDVYQTF